MKLKFFAFSMLVFVALYGLIGYMIYSQGAKQAQAQRNYYASILNDGN